MPAGAYDLATRAPLVINARFQRCTPKSPPALKWPKWKRRPASLPENHSGEKPLSKLLSEELSVPTKGYDMSHKWNADRPGIYYLRPAQIEIFTSLERLISAAEPATKSLLQKAAIHTGKKALALQAQGKKQEELFVMCFDSEGNPLNEKDDPLRRI